MKLKFYVVFIKYINLLLCFFFTIFFSIKSFLIKFYTKHKNTLYKLYQWYKWYKIIDNISFLVYIIFIDPFTTLNYVWINWLNESGSVKSIEGNENGDTNKEDKDKKGKEGESSINWKYVYIGIGLTIVAGIIWVGYQLWSRGEGGFWSPPAPPAAPATFTNTVSVEQILNDKDYMSNCNLAGTYGSIQCKQDYLNEHARLAPLQKVFLEHDLKTDYNDYRQAYSYMKKDQNQE